MRNAYFDHSVVVFVESIEALDEFVEVLEFLEGGPDSWTELNEILSDRKGGNRGHAGGRA